MTDSEERCLIPGNPDIAGIGVRSAVYLQAGLAIATFAYLLQTYVNEGPVLLERYILAKAQANDPPQQHEEEQEEEQEEGVSDVTRAHNDAVSVSTTDSERQRRRKQQKLDAIIRFTGHGRRIDEDKECLSMSRSLSRAIILIGAAVLVSTLLEAKDRGLTPYHALIILNVSLINNWSAMIISLISKYLTAKHFVLTLFSQSARRGLLVDETVILKSRWKWVAALLLDEAALLIHVYITCAVGLWFWAKPKDRAFTRLNDEACPPIVTLYWVFTAIPTTSRGLRITSLVAYSVYTFFTLPLPQNQFGALTIPIFLTLVTLLPFIFILILFLALETIFVSLSHRSFQTGPLFQISWKVIDILNSFDKATLSRRHELDGRGNRKKIYALVSKAAIPLTLLGVAPYIYLVIATEQIVRINKAKVSEGEKDWTYGQTLAVFSAIVAACTFIATMGKVVIERKRIQRDQDAPDEEKAAVGEPNE